MYLPHFGLNKPPFSISPDPNFLWFSAKHKQAFSALKYGILEEKGFLSLIGEIGTGKTLLIKELINEIGIPAIIVNVPDPDMDTLDFFTFLAEEAKMNKTFRAKGEFLIHFKRFLLDAFGSDKKVLLIVDEAQRLNFELLEQIRLLSNIEMANRKLLNIFFVGQNEFDEMLTDERSKATQQRIAVRYRLEPLDEEETALYIDHRLKVAGANREIFSSDAIREIYNLSNGSPRLINIICDNALMVGYGLELEIINKDIILEYKKELNIPEEIEPTKKEEPELKKEEPELIQSNQKKPNKIVKPAQLKEETSRKAPSYLKNSIIFVFFLLFGFAGYYIYNFNTANITPWTVQDIAPKTDFGLAKTKPEDIRQKSMYPTEKPRNNQIADVLPNRKSIDGESAVKIQPHPEPVKLDKAVNEKLIPQSLPEETGVAESGKKKELKTKSLDLNKAPDDKIKEQKTSVVKVAGSHIENAPINESIEAGDQETPLFEDPSIIDEKIITIIDEKLTIYFNYNSLELSEQSRETLKLVLEINTKYPHSNIIIEGYTDSIGNYWYNKKLSLSRANVVKIYFNSQGISSLRIKTEGMGSQNPIGNNETPEGRRQNRRVEIKVKSNGKEVSGKS